MAQVKHKHGRGTSNVHTGRVEVVGPGSEPIGARTISREDVPGYRGKQRDQSTRVERGNA